jgi:hypothetical protein
MFTVFTKIKGFFSGLTKKVSDYFGNQDRQQKINTIGNVIGESFKILMASLLVVFVPQKCYDNYETKEGPHVCTFNENFQDLTDFNMVVLCYNFITLSSFIYLYYVEIRREKWMIDHLEYDDKEDEHHLITHQEKYPKIINRMMEHNIKYAKTYKVVKYLYVSNFIVSSVLIIDHYYMDYRTITTLLTNLALCIGKVFKGSELATRSLQNKQGLSYYNIRNISFNTIDPDYIKRTSLKSIELTTEIKQEEIKQEEIKLEELKEPKEEDIGVVVFRYENTVL